MLGTYWHYKFDILPGGYIWQFALKKYRLAPSPPFGKSDISLLIKPICLPFFHILLPKKLSKLMTKCFAATAGAESRSGPKKAPLRDM